MKSVEIENSLNTLLWLRIIVLVSDITVLVTTTSTQAIPLLYRSTTDLLQSLRIWVVKMPFNQTENV